MASKKQKQKGGDDTQHKEQLNSARTPWIQYRTGIIVIAITSVAMVVLSIREFINAGVGVPEGILRGLAYGVLIWAIFFGYLFFQRFIRRM